MGEVSSEWCDRGIPTKLKEIYDDCNTSLALQIKILGDKKFSNLQKDAAAEIRMLISNA